MKYIIVNEGKNGDYGYTFTRVGGRWRKFYWGEIEGIRYCQKCGCLLHSFDICKEDYHDYNDKDVLEMIHGFLLDGLIVFADYNSIQLWRRFK